MIAITRIIQISETVVLDYNSTSKTRQDQIDEINSDTFQQSSKIYSIS